MPMALSLSLLLDVLFIRFQSSDIDTSIAAFLVLTGLPSGRRWSVRVSNNKRIEIVKKQNKRGAAIVHSLFVMLVLLIFLFFQILFFKFIGADDLHSTESKRGVCSAGDSKKKNSEREKKGKRKNWVYWNILNVF
jgi:hypothetical protein